MRKVPNRKPQEGMKMANVDTSRVKWEITEKVLMGFF